MLVIVNGFPIGNDDTRANILKKRIDYLLDSISQLASLIDRDNMETVKKMDEVYRQAEQIKQDFNGLIENVDRFSINE